MTFKSKKPTNQLPYSPPARHSDRLFRKAHETEPRYKHEIRTLQVWCHVSNPAYASEIRRVVVESFPSIAFSNFESAVSLSMHQLSGEDRTPTTLFVDDGTICTINKEKLKQVYPHITIILLSDNRRICSLPKKLSEAEYPEIKNVDLIATTSSSFNLNLPDTIASFIRLAEDELRVHHRLENPKRFIVLVVDDEPHWIAEFLPQLYSIIGKRADIVVKETYEDAKEFIDRFGEFTACIISDLFFPMGGEITGSAGRTLVAYVNEHFPRIAKIVSSQATSGEEFQSIALVFRKGEPNALNRLKRFIKDYAGFGDFLINIKGVAHRIRTIPELRGAVADADLAILDVFAKKDFFSTWLYMHGFYTAGDALKTDRSTGKVLRLNILKVLDSEIESLNSDPFIIRNSSDQVVCSTFSLKEIREQMYILPDEMMEKWEADDLLSDWLMRHGFARLADELRPIQGTGDDVKIKIIEIMDKWIRVYEQRGILVG